MTEHQFIEQCTGCGQCISACPENILIAARGQYPKVSFEQGACTFCRACLDICPTSALEESTETEKPWPYVAKIKESCLSKHGIMCRICGDTCSQQAITFKMRLGGVSDPIIDTKACTACGACLRLCVTDAIEINTVAATSAHTQQDQTTEFND